MSLIFEPKECLRRWAEAEIPSGHLGFGSDAAYVAVDDVAILVFNRWIAGGADVSLATRSPRWCTKATVKELNALVFGYWGLRRLEARVEVENSRCIRLMNGLNFQFEGYLRQASWRGHDMHLLTLSALRWTSKRA